VVRDSALEKLTALGPSSCVACGSREESITVTNSAISAVPIGRLTKNAHCRPNACMTSPQNTGHAAKLMPTTAPQNGLRVRVRCPERHAIAPRALRLIATPHLHPCDVRAATSSGRFHASLHSDDANANNMELTSKSCLRPKRSASMSAGVTGDAKLSI
jgi:hypothetical protein